MRHVLLISGLCLSASLAFGQTFGSITGEVRDPSGAVMPNASVTATNVATSGICRPFAPPTTVVVESCLSEKEEIWATDRLLA